MTGMSLFNLQELAKRRLVALLEFWAVLLPQRIVDEDLGDYVEDINRRRDRGETWQPGVRAFRPFFGPGSTQSGT
jgi:hypothetical protein